MPDIAPINLVSILETVNLDPVTVYHILKNLPGKLSKGPDGLPNIFYKKLAVVLALPLSLIFEASLRQSTLPNDWRSAKVMPIFKRSGKNSDPAGYRPVSLTCVACKIMEKAIKSAIVEHCKNNKLLPDFQHGGRQYRSTTTQLIECVDSYLQGLSQNKPSDAVFFDISKAFDSVSHPKLIYKLPKLGIRGNLLAWIVDYLSNRTQVVCVGSQVSHVGDVTSGVPQGGPLSGLLFLLYLSDIHANCTSTVKLFFDDLKLINPCTELGRKELQSDIDSIANWMTDWQLSIAAGKCFVLHVCGQARNSDDCLGDYMLHDTVLPKTNAVKDLGILFDSKLLFEQHISNVVAKATRTSNAILRTFVSRDYQFLYQLFQAYVNPILEYGATVWFPTHNLRHNLQATRLESVLRRYTKRFRGMHNLSYSDRLHEINAKSILCRSIHNDLVLFFKYLHGQACMSLSRPPHKFNSGHSTRLATSNYLQLDPVKYPGKYQFWLDRSVKLWENLPEAITNAPTLSNFKNLLDKIELSELLR